MPKCTKINKCITIAFVLKYSLKMSSQNFKIPKPESTRIYFIIEKN